MARMADIAHIHTEFIRAVETVLNVPVTVMDTRDPLVCTVKLPYGELYLSKVITLDEIKGTN